MRERIPWPPTVSIDMPSVKQLTPKAGSITFYHGGGTSHGVMGWEGEQERRAVLKVAIPTAIRMQDVRLAHIVVAQPRL